MASKVSVRVVVRLPEMCDWTNRAIDLVFDFYAVREQHIKFSLLQDTSVNSILLITDGPFESNLMRIRLSWFHPWKWRRTRRIHPVFVIKDDIDRECSLLCFGTLG
jgi:hypothetical protein